MSFQVTGTIIKIYDEVHRSSNFNTREFVIETNDRPYPQKVILQLINNNCDLIIGKKPGDDVTCHLNIKGREWNGPNGVKYYNTIEVWKIFDANAE